MDKSKMLEKGCSKGAQTEFVMLHKPQPTRSCDPTECSSVESRSVQGRGNWGGQIEFVLSLIGYAIGLGNLWRFPYLCMRNGGGAFLIPYFLFLFLVAMPLYFLEIILGQFSSLGPISLWKISPLFKGLGYGMCLVSGVVCIYYNVIMAWCLFYTFKSFTLGTLPWATCGNWWNTKHCAHRTTFRSFVASAGNLSHLEKNRLLPGYGNETTGTSGINVSEMLVNVTSTVTAQKTTPTEEFWQRYVLQVTTGIDDVGSVRLELLACLFLAWLAVFLCLFKGVKSLGKVIYVTATVPYLMLFVLFIRGVTLPGAIDGIKYYLYPDFSKLANFSVWCEACAQIFYSLGMAYGGLITMASYNTFNHNCYRNSVVIPIVNCVTSFFAGFVVFSVIGYLSWMSGVEVSKVIASGPGLAFVVYPEALAMLPGSAIWSVLFFMTLFTVGLDTQFGMFETMITGFADEYPNLLKTTNRKTLLTGLVCLLEFLLGIPLITQGGIYVFQIFDWYCATFALMSIAFLETIVVGWIYGSDRIYRDIELMLGKRICRWWKVCWMIISPAILLIVLIFTMAMFTPPKYGDYEYPGWANALGWCLAVCSLLPIPICMFTSLLTAKGTLMERLHSQLQPASSWGPALVINRKSSNYMDATNDLGEPLNMEEDA